MTIRVLSLNIWLGGVLFDQALAFIRDQDADIVALQEVYDGKEPTIEQRFRCFSILKEKLGLDYSDFAPAYLDNRDIGNIELGNAVFSRFPIVSRKVTFFNEPYQEDYIDSPANYESQPHNLQQLSLDSPRGMINLMNFHGVWDMDGDNPSPKRLQMSHKIIKAADGMPRTIITGDTNAKPTNQAMLEIEKYYRSVFGNDLKTTFNMRRKTNPGYATAAVDHMYVSEDMRVAFKQCPDVDVSDHLPLIVDLEIS